MITSQNLCPHSGAKWLLLTVLHLRYSLTEAILKLLLAPWPSVTLLHRYISTSKHKELVSSDPHGYWWHETARLVSHCWAMVWALGCIISLNASVFSWWIKWVWIRSRSYRHSVQIVTHAIVSRLSQKPSWEPKSRQWYRQNPKTV